jgi:lysophospholipase L1-like esterase
MYAVTFRSKYRYLENGKVEEGIFVKKWFFKYPKTASFFKEIKQDVNQIKTLDSIVNNVGAPIGDDEFEAQIKPNFAEIDTTKIQRLLYPKNAEAFINQLKLNLKSSKSRIIHYGDSQIEGDRMSGYIRNRLQGYFGGGGPGFIPIVQAYQQISAVVTPSNNWKRYAAFDPTHRRFSHKKYGAYTSISRFTKVYDFEKDSVNLKNIEITKATVEIGVSQRSYALLKNVTSIGLHYGNAQTPTSINIFNDDVLIKSDSLIVDGNYHKYTINLPIAPKNLKIEMSAKISPDFYGLTLDADRGISFDNVAMRGASGTVFAAMDSDNFSQMYQQLQPKILIFQFGGNTVPYLKDSLNIKNYADNLKNHINWVRSKTNNASVIFIGPSDMTTRENGQLVTYELLPYLNKVLKETCYENGIAYWSLFHAMGGKNSMKHWVDEKLAASDYTHFSPSGTKVVSELFFLALYMDLIQEK